MLLTQRKDNVLTAKSEVLWRSCTLADKRDSQAKRHEFLKDPLAVETPEGIYQVPPNSPGWILGKVNDDHVSHAMNGYKA